MILRYVEASARIFDTAVFFDVENLLGGYDNDAIANVSISEIMYEIREAGGAAGDISAIAVNRAYANWSISRLSVLRREIVEEGIEPKQIFGFDRGEKKNAADIELVIEAIDLAYTRPALRTFVIVSGDGGFASLVKKLHELGKTVVVCAYPDRISPALRAVCDVYIDLAAGTAAGVTSTDRASIPGTKITDPRLRAAVDDLAPLRPDAAPMAATKRAYEVIARLASQPSLAQELSDRGLTLALVGQALAQQLPAGAPNYGFRTLKVLLQQALVATEFALAENPDDQPPHPRVVHRSTVPPGLEVLPDPDIRVVYKAVLERDLPRLFVPEPAQLASVANELVSDPPHDVSLAQMIERVSERIEGMLSTEHVKFMLGAFVAAGVFDRTPAHERLINQTLTLKDSLRTPQDLAEVLRRAVEAKLRRGFASIDEATLDAMFDLPAQTTRSEAT